MPGRRDAAIALGIFALTCAVYAGALANGFVRMDDPAYVTENPLVRGGLSLQAVRVAFGELRAANWHPLTWISHMLDVELFGLAPAGHHATSVVLHALSSALLFVAWRRLGGAFGPAATAPAAWLALAFGLHPLHVESVAWVSERKDVLCGLFWVLSLLAYAGWVQRPSGARYALLLGAFGLGLLSKPTIATLPAALLLLDVWPLRRAHPWRALLVEKLPLFAMAAAFAAWIWIVHASAIRTDVAPLAAVATSLVATGAYLAQTLVPVGLSPLYPLPEAPETGRAIASALALAVLGALAWRERSRRPYLLVGGLWFVGTLLPVSGVVPIGYHARADRYMYIPLIGIFAALAWGGAELARRGPRARRAVGALACALLAFWGARTVAQVAVWRDTRTLFEHALALDPDNYVARTEVAILLERDGELDAALAEYRRALADQPSYARARANLGHALLSSDQPAEALAELEAARRLAPNMPEIYFQTALSLEALGRTREALAYHVEELRRQPRHASARARALALAHRLGDPELARSLAVQLGEIDARRPR
jgi:tetratricopeptide (TPR) repeat protein